jgi:hypothetical protein
VSLPRLFAAALMISAAALGAVPVASAAETGRAGAAATAAAPTSVAIVIAGVGVGCVPWRSGISGDTVLNDVARVNYRPSDHLITQIDGIPANGIANDNHYWAYWHESAAGWQYSDVGASGYFPKAGAVDGWSFGGGASTTHPKPPVRSYASICPAAQPKPSSSPTHRTASSASSPAHASSPAGRTTTRTTAAPPPASRGSSSPQVRASSAPATVPAASAAPVPGSPVPAVSSPPVSPGTTGSALPTLVTRPAGAPRPSSGSATPTVIGVSLAALIVIGTGLLAWQRRRRLSR